MPETTGLYPGLVVWEERVGGSITIGRTRLPMWAVLADLVADGWDTVDAEYLDSRHGFDERDMTGFLCSLLELRNNFGRLILILADVERITGKRLELADTHHWTEDPTLRARVVAALEVCLDELNSRPPTPPITPPDILYDKDSNPTAVLAATYPTPTAAVRAMVTEFGVDWCLRYFQCVSSALTVDDDGFTVLGHHRPVLSEYRALRDSMSLGHMSPFNPEPIEDEPSDLAVGEAWFRCDPDHLGVVAYWRIPE